MRLTWKIALWAVPAVRRRPIQEGARAVYVDVKLVRDLDGGRSVTVMLNGQRITLDERYLDRAD